MRILYVDFNYVFNLMLHETILQQRVKYSFQKMPKNLIVLNKYNLIIDTVLSVSSMIDKLLSSMNEKYDEVYIFNNRLNVARNLPSGYNSGYYITSYKRFGNINDVINSNMYTTKLLKTCLSKIASNAEIEIETETETKTDTKKKAKNSRKNKFKIRLAKNVNSTVNEYAKEYEKQYTDKWREYNPTEPASKTNKISYYIKDFRINVFMTQNHLTDTEINDIYNYLVKACKIKQTKLTDFKPSDDSQHILTDKLFTNKSIHMAGRRVQTTTIKYLAINKKDGKIKNANMIYKLKHQEVMKLLPFKRFNGKLLDIVMKAKNNVWMKHIIDIDQDNLINMFTEHTQEDLYNKAHTNSILTNYNYVQNYNNVGFVNEDIYIRYMDRVLKAYKFDNFKLV